MMTDAVSGAPEPDTNWHNKSIAQILQQLSSSESGLTTSDAEARLKTYGPNSLPQSPMPTRLEIFVRQFQSPLIYILVVAALVSVAIGEVKDAAFIAAVLLINAMIGVSQEWRAEQSSRALQQLLKIRAAVIRDGEVSEFDAEAVVPGDIVWLESGNRIPADLRLIGAHGLQVDESLLTGESIAVLKEPEWMGASAIPLADRQNMAHAGSIVVRGRGTGVVVATGMATHVGQLAKDVLGLSGGRPPLLERMDTFSRNVAVAVFGAAIAISVFGILGGGYRVGEMFFFAVALAVSAIPEGLPVALTVALAVGTTRMARRGVIVRRLAAVEGLGSCTLVASDKTGTLTCNELTVREIRLPQGETFEVTGEGFVPDGQVLLEGQAIAPTERGHFDALARAAVLCNEGDLHHRNGTWIWRGDPTDIALLSMAHKLAWKREATLQVHPQVNEIPFEAEHQFSASYHLVENQVLVCVKGAPERVLPMCEGFDANSDEWHAHAEAMAERGYRVLALAQGIVGEPVDRSQAPPEPSGLLLLGFVGMIDPLRPGVIDAVKACHQAGITVAMVTGDHPTTALAIARELGMATRADQVVMGCDIETQSIEALSEMLSHARVFARVSPHQKLQLVRAAREAGHYVAVTGDGVNDAPALREANIGVAMGKGGTDVAREAAELVISDDNFATITAGVEEGRIAYDNIRKVIYLLISTGAAEVVLVCLAVATGMPLPLLPVQLLWLNLVTNGIQDVALAFEPSEGDTLRRKPRPPQESIFNQLMLERTAVAAVVMGVMGFGLFVWLLGAGWSEDDARNILLLLMVLFENVHVFNSRSETKSVFAHSPLRSPIVLAGVAIGFSVHLAALYIPLGQTLLGTSPVEAPTWMLLIGMASVLLLVMEIHKMTWAYRQRSA